MPELPKLAEIDINFAPNSVTLLPATKFWLTYRELVNRAQDRAYMQAMVLQGGHITGLLFDAFQRAAERHVPSYITFDANSRLAPRGETKLIRLPSFLQTAEDRRITHTRDMAIDRLHKSGVWVYEQNDQSPFKKVSPCFCCDHRKIYGIDGVKGLPIGSRNLVGISGCNITDRDYSRVDFGAFFTYPEIVDAYRKMYFENFNHHESPNDYEIQCNPHYSILVAMGKSVHSPFHEKIAQFRSGKSNIYERAVDLVKSARKSIRFVSPFVPDEDLLREIIRKAAVGVRVDMMTSHIDHKVYQDLPHVLGYWRYLLETGMSHKYATGNMRIHHHDTEEVHAKWLMIDAEEDGYNRTESGIIYTGSDNLIKAGPRFGTKETMVQSTDPQFLTQANNIVKGAWKAA